MKTYTSVYQNIFKNLPLKILLIGLFLVLTSFSIKNTFFTDTNDPTEKVYLHLDKSFYSSEETIWFKVYLVDGSTNQPKTLSKIVHVDLVDPNNKIVNTRSIKIDKGGGAGEFRLSFKLHSGSYFIRAYTNYMQNFDDQYYFRKKIYIQSLSTDEIYSEEIANEGMNGRPDMQFFPEGGNLVNSIPGRIGFKVLGSNGKGIDVNGRIIDENGNEIQKFATTKFGLGRFNFITEKKNKYRAHIKYANKDYFYELPQALDNGITMQVEDLADHYQIIIQSSLAGGVNNLLLLGQQKGKVIGRAKITGSEKGSTINIPKSIFKQGIVQFTLIDNNKKPWCERLVFVDIDADQPQVNITFSKENYQKRELVEMELSLDQKTQNTPQLNMSVAITDMQVVSPDDFGLNIESYLLLASDLRGEIENPSYYFKTSDHKRKELLDILMMTQGWRRFENNKLPDNQKDQFVIEKGIYLSGSVKNTSDHENISSKATLLLKNKGHSFSDTILTTDQGHFFMGPYNIIDSTTFTIQVLNINNKKGKKYKKNRRDYYIEFDKFKSPKVTFQSAISNDLNKDYDVSYMEKSTMVYPENSHLNDSDNTNKLDEIILKPVTVKKVDTYEFKKEKMGVKHRGASQLISSDQLENAAEGNLIAILESRIPGLSIKGDFITLRGNTTVYQSSYPKEPEKPLFLLDNVATSFEAVSNLWVNSIDFVEVLTGSRAAIYGSRASHGVIAIYTKSATGANRISAVEEANKPEIHEQNEILQFVHPGYYKAREFYEPIYKTDRSDYSTPDYRTTIYWSPDIKFNAQGKAKMLFHTADIPTTYRVDVQGITVEGIPVVSEALMDVR